MEKRVNLTLIKETVNGSPALTVRYQEPMEPDRNLMTRFMPVDEQKVRKEAEEMFAGYDSIRWIDPKKLWI